MPKDTSRFRYLYPAIPLDNTLLLHYLAEQRALTNIDEAQLLVKLATDQVRLLRGMGSSVMMTAPAAPVSPLSPEPPQGIHGISIADNDIDFEAFGPPDED